MEQKDKELLLKDLCARLPYGVKVHIGYNWYGEEKTTNAIMRGVNGNFVIYDSFTGEEETSITKVKPYLRPMSNMTDGEKNELIKLTGSSIDKVIDFYISNHFDYKGLIPKGLALEAKEGMYKL